MISPRKASERVIAFSVIEKRFWGIVGAIEGRKAFGRFLWDDKLFVTWKSNLCYY